MVALLQHVEDEDFLDELVKRGERAGKPGTPSGLPRQVRHALRRRDRHHEAALERAAPSTRPLILSNNQRTLEPGAGERRLEQGASGGVDEGREVLERLRPLPDGERRPKSQADDRPGPDLHPGTGSIRSTAWSAATSLQAGPAGRGRAPRAGHVLGEQRRTSSTSLPGASQRGAREPG